MRPVSLALSWVALFATSIPAQETMAGFMVEEYSCIMCHTGMRTDFLQGVHSRRGILCTDCHGGDPTQFEIESAHSSGFGGPLDKAGAVALCLSCHSDASEMRQYALEPVTREMFLVSQHGQRLLNQGDSLAPACGDCHGSHAIFPRTDPRSPVNPVHIGETCAACHSDAARVGTALATDQYSDWAESAHGQALIFRHNEQSASCASCHGSHAALPPGVREIPNVCGKCHQLVRDAYFQGPHGQLEAGVGEGIPCTSCHENHRTDMPPLGEIGTLCSGCHEPESFAGTSGLELQEEIQRAQAAGARAREHFQVLVEAGERIDNERVNLLEVETHLQELLMRAHTLDPEVVDEIERNISDLAAEVGDRADSVEEHHFERKLLAIPVWVLLLGGILLALRKRRRLPPIEGDGPWGLGGGIDS